MKRFLVFALTALLMALVPSTLDAKKKGNKDDIIKWSNYEVSTNAVGQSGTKSLKVWGYGKKIDKAIEQAKKNAVHACLFRGIPGAQNARPTPAIFENQGNDKVLQENLEYFWKFFEDEDIYLQYVNLTTDGMPSGQDRREVKGGYKVGLNVQVMYDNLRKRMEADGILKKAGDRFTY